jgi:integrase
MRQPRKARCPKSAKFPKAVKYFGPVEYRGRQKWVGTFATRDQWQKKAEQKMVELRDAVGVGPKVAVPSVAEFLGVVVEGERIRPRDPQVEIWPWTHLRDITKNSSARVLAENIRCFARRYSDRPVNSFSRPEAREIAAGYRNGQKAAVRRLFADIVDDGYLESNPFRGLSVKQVSRLQREGFRLITEKEFDTLMRAAEASRVDDYGLTLRAMVLLEGTTGMRPSELFAMERTSLNREQGYFEIWQQVDDRGELVLVKNSWRRLVPATEEVIAAIDAAPVLSDRWFFPAVRGGLLTLSGWHDYWNAIRVAAGLPDLEFYELKHRAITWMCTPAPDGLGIDPGDVAEIIGHRDGGETIRRFYLQLDQRKAVARFHSARAQYAQPLGLAEIGATAGLDWLVSPSRTGPATQQVDP